MAKPQRLATLATIFAATKVNVRRFRLNWLDWLDWLNWLNRQLCNVGSDARRQMPALASRAHSQMPAGLRNCRQPAASRQPPASQNRKGEIWR